MDMSSVHQVRPNPSCSETGKVEKEMGRKHQGMDRPGVRQVLEGSAEQRKMGEAGCEMICATIPTVKG